MPVILLGVEEYLMSHVQGGTTPGHRLKDEHQTLIVALMRGGLPMAQGVYNSLPTAMLALSYNHQDLIKLGLTGMNALDSKSSDFFRPF